MRPRTIFVMAMVLAALAVVFFLFNRGQESELSAKPRPFVWSFEFGELKHISISLPREGKNEAWVKRDDKHWYFDQPDGPKVNMKRWGGGVPLILSGPGAERLIAEESTAEQLGIYGLQNPRMRIDLVTENKSTLSIVVGDTTPDLQSYYIKNVDSRAVFSVDRSWYEVLERLVLEPPYPEPEIR